MKKEACNTVYVNTFTDGVLDPSKPMLGPVKDGGFIVANTTPECWGPMITPPAPRRPRSDATRIRGKRRTGGCHCHPYPVHSGDVCRHRFRKRSDRGGAVFGGSLCGRPVPGMRDGSSGDAHRGNRDGVDRDTPADSTVSVPEPSPETSTVTTTATGGAEQSTASGVASTAEDTARSTAMAQPAPQTTAQRKRKRTLKRSSAN